MEDRFRGHCSLKETSSPHYLGGEIDKIETVDFNGEFWWCETDKLELSKYVEQKTPDSKVAITFNSPNSDTKPVPISETARYDKMSPWQKIGAKLVEVELSKSGISTKSNRPQPVKAFCHTCNKERSTLGHKCPVCQSIIVKS